MLLNIWNIQSSIYRILRLNPVSFIILRKENRIVRTLLDRIPLACRKTILDIGSGRGNSLSILRKYPGFRVGADSSIGMLRRTSADYPQFPLVVSDAKSLAFRDQAAGTVLAIGVSEYLSDIRKFLGELNRIIKPGGFLILTSSPPGVLSRIRTVLGHRLYLRNVDELRILFYEFGMEIIVSDRTLIQNQFLLRRKID